MGPEGDFAFAISRHWRENRPGNLQRLVVISKRGQASSVSADADVAPCADGRRTVADRAVTIAAWIPEAAADSPANS
jgi:hypothetical protein